MKPPPDPLPRTPRAAAGHGAIVDVFCGVGGLSHGFVRAGFNVVAGIDADSSCQHAFEVNNGARFIGKALEAVDADEIVGLYPTSGWKVLIGCAPCQPFSSYTPRKKRKRTDQWTLLELFADRILEVEPDVVSMENVPRLASFDGGRTLRAFINRLEECYRVSWGVVNCAELGVPQERHRLVLLASKHGSIELPRATHAMPVTVREAIGDLPAIEAGGTHDSDPLHKAPLLSDLNFKRIRASKPGGTWHDWPKELRAECHRKESGRWYRTVYGRMSWDAPAPTITTGCFGYGRGRFGHPEQDRAISLREAALLQSFPMDYEFVDPDEQVSFERVGRHIGNAVPVRLGEALAGVIARHIEEVSG